jgi:hypothetical protein
MKAILYSTFALALLGGVALAPSAHAANARHPYSNVNHANDAGNDTGDSRVDQLNSAQLNQNYYQNQGQGQGQGMGMGQQGGPAVGGMASPSGATSQ